MDEATKEGMRIYKKHTRKFYRCYPENLVKGFTECYGITNRSDLNELMAVCYTLGHLHGWMSGLDRCDRLVGRLGPQLETINKKLEKVTYHLKQ